MNKMSHQFHGPRPLITQSLYHAHRIKESNSIRGKSSCVSSEKPLSNIVCKFELSTNLTLGKIPETYGFNLYNVALSELDFV